MFSSIKSKYILFLLPIVYGVLALCGYYQSKSFFSTYPDSIYIYLINGTNIASGNFDIGHYDNPGTTVHLFAGLIIYLTHLFSGSGPIVEDVLSNPEYYLRICVIVVGALLLLSVYLSGKLILNHTKNLPLALLFQLIPISSYFAIHYLLLVRIIPETLIMIAITYYAAFLFVLCYKREELSGEPINTRTHIVFFSFITAFLIITKITCLPFLIIPFFFIKTRYQRVRYITITFLFAAAFTYPVWPHLPTMLNWFKGLATHSGPYGQGNEELFNSHTFISNVILLFKREVFFFTIYIFITGLALVALIKKRWNDNYYKLLFAVWIVMTGQIVFSAKHFGYHYLIAAQSLAIPALAASSMILVKSKRPAWNYAILIICFFWFAYRTDQSLEVYRSDNLIHKTSLSAKKYSNVPKIITTGYQGACFPESGLRFGSCYGGNYFQSSNFFLRKLYPNSYFYDMYLGVNYVRWWDIVVPIAQLFEGKPEILFYIINWDENQDRNIIKVMTAGSDSLIKDIQLVESNDATGERFYMIHVDTSKANPRYKESITIHCDMETKNTDKNKFLSSDGKYEFSGVEQISLEQAFSSKTSVLTSEKYPFACFSDFPVKPGDFFDISVNCLANNQPGIIVLSATDRNIFFKSSESICEEYKNGWKKVNLKTIIPVDYPDSVIKFNLYYSGKETCYFDDLTIDIHKK